MLFHHYGFKSLKNQSIRSASYPLNPDSQRRTSISGSRGQAAGSRDGDKIISLTAMASSLLHSLQAKEETRAIPSLRIQTAKN